MWFCFISDWFVVGERSFKTHTLMKNSFNFKIVKAMTSKVINFSTIYLKAIGYNISLFKKLDFPHFNRRVVSHDFIRND